MSKNPVMLYKSLVIGVIILFIGVGIQPAFATNQYLESDKEYVELIIETCGILRVTQYSIQLPKEQAEEIEKYLNNINNQLDKVNSREDAEEILNNVVIELDKYGLLNDLSVKQVQKLIFNTYLNLRLTNLIEKINSGEKKENNTRNTLCLVATKVEGVSICITLRYFIFLEWLWSFLSDIPGLTFEQVSKISAIFEIGYLFFPFRLLGTTIVFNIEPIDLGAEVLKYFSIGLRGIKMGGQWTFMFGFTGLNILMYSKGITWYIGSALSII